MCINIFLNVYVLKGFVSFLLPRSWLTIQRFCENLV